MIGTNMQGGAHDDSASLELPRQATGAARWLARNRYQLLVATLIGVLFPALMRLQFQAPMEWVGFGIRSPDTIKNTMIGTFSAMLAGAYLRRRITTYPGPGSVAVVIPAFSTTYFIAIAWFAFLHLEFARAQFALSFGLVLAWFGLISLLEPRLRRNRFLVLPFGKVAGLLSLPLADWVIARGTPELPSGITGVVADLRADIPNEWQRLLSNAALAGVPVYHWKQIAESLSGKVDIEHLSENNLGSLLPSSVYIRVKYAIDAGIAILTLPITLPIALVAATAILVKDGRPIIFSQNRIGLAGRPFTMFKFRTMSVGSEAGRAYTTPDDSRVTGLGRILRRFRIDELPQIVNILRGEMSWIGPRPESTQLSEWYECKVPFYSYRHIVRPGISGWAAVHQGNVAEIEAATAKLKYDFFYVKYFSPWLDLLIAAKTVKILLTGFGAR